MAETTKKKELYDGSYVDRLQQSQAALDSHLTAKPGDYQSKYQGQIDQVMQNITNRKPFQYDVNADALYQQYKDRYTQMGRQAMQDTMGQAAALTGGYGNTYAQNAGQQAYGAYMQGLTDKIPELYQLALDKYDRDAALEKEKYSVLKDADATDYGRWGDRLNQWNTDRSYLSGRVDTELSQAMSIGNTMYARLAELAAKGYTPTDDELRGAGMTREQWDKLHPAYVPSYAPVAGTGTGTGGGTPRSRLTQEQIKANAAQIKQAGGSGAAIAYVKQATSENNLPLLQQDFYFGRTSSGTAKKKTGGTPSR